MSTTIILVEPEIPENIGFVARAMNCYGYNDLICVGLTTMPDKAFKTGTAAQEILENTRFFPTLPDALGPYVEILGFSRRDFNLSQPTFNLPDYMQKDVPTVLVFGRESQGLTKDEIACCTKIISIPSSHETLSFNLGQAVAIALYEFNRVEEHLDTPEKPVAPFHQKEALLAYLCEHTSEEFLKKGNREEQLKSLIRKWDISEEEMHLFMGVVKKIHTNG